MARGSLTMAVIGESPSPSDRARFTKLVGFWAPSRFVSENGIDVQAFLADLNEKISTRGMIMRDGQVITTPLPSDGVDPLFERLSLREVNEPSPRRAWGPAERALFGLENPYQMADEQDTFTWSSIMTRVAGPYLADGELIAGLIHGVSDHYYFNCPCHFAQVVYTARGRLVCMSCGALHAILRAPLTAPGEGLLTSEHFADLFDDDGARRHEQVDLPLVDFCAIEGTELAWTTSWFDEAAAQFVFFARSPPEVVAEAIRGTEMDSTIFMEAGFTEVPLAPPPAAQVDPAEIDVDLAENAAHTFEAGVRAYRRSYTERDQLLTAVPQLFRAIELLLKARLELEDPAQLADKPNTPAVIERLAALGIDLSSAEHETVTSLRRLRNAMQHGRPRFNGRDALGLCGAANVFIDRFTDAELGLWTADALHGDENWRALLEMIPELAATAERVSAERVAEARENPQAEITGCPTCDRYTLVRAYPESGSRCLYCGSVPRVE